MFEYEAFVCRNEECDMRGHLQYRAWDRHPYDHRKSVWLTSAGCKHCNRRLVEYPEFIREEYPEGYMPPMISMRCHNTKCDRYGMTYMQAFDTQFRDMTHVPYYHGDTGNCPECSVPMMDEAEWASTWHSSEDTHGRAS